MDQISILTVLQLFLLDLKLPARFVQLMHRASALTKLIEKILKAA